MFTTGNPALSQFEKPQRWDELAMSRSKAMSIGGTVTATGVLLGICAASAMISWTSLIQPAVAADNLGAITPWLFGSMIGGLVLSLVCFFAQKTTPFVGPVFAAVEGVFLASVSAFIMARFLGGMDVGLIFQAITLTFGIFAAMLLGYATGIIRATPLLMKMIMIGVGGLLVYVAALFIGNGLFGLGIPNLYASASPLGIGFTVVVLALASFSLVMDFELVKQGVEHQMPKHMEWVAAVGLLVTLVWIYIEVLRLLAKLRSND